MNKSSTVVSKVILLSLLYLSIISTIDSLVKFSERATITKISIVNVVQNSTNIQELLNVEINNSNLFEKYNFNKINQNTYSVTFSTKDDVTAENIKNLFKNEVDKISKRIFINFEELNMLNTKFKNKKDINIPIDYFIIKTNPEFIKLKFEELGSKKLGYQDEHLIIKFVYFGLISFALSITTFFFKKNINTKSIKKIIVALS